jgi:hypothetical protein
MFLVDREAIWAVVLIHGVGFTRPGVALEQFFKALQENGQELEQIGSPEVRMLKKASERLPPPKYTKTSYEDPNQNVLLTDRFPMHLRNANVKNPKPGESLGGPQREQCSLKCSGLTFQLLVIT